MQHTADPSPIQWDTPAGLGYTDVLYQLAQLGSGQVAKITINRPEVRNAFRPETVRELIDAFHRAHMDPAVGVIVLTGAGDLAFCSGGDQPSEFKMNPLAEGRIDHHFDQRAGEAPPALAQTPRQGLVPTGSVTDPVVPEAEGTHQGREIQWAGRAPETLEVRQARLGQVVEYAPAAIIQDDQRPVEPVGEQEPGQIVQK